MTRLTEQEALSLLIEMVEEDHTVYASGAEAVARWKRLRAFACDALAAEERGRLWKEKEMETLRGALALANKEINRLIAIASDVAERGRRRGVEERDELLRKLLAWADSSPVKAVTMSAWIHGVKFKPEDVAIWDEVRAALAPRDLGKEG